MLLFRRFAVVGVRRSSRCSRRRRSISECSFSNLRFYFQQRLSFHYGIQAQHNRPKRSLFSYLSSCGPGKYLIVGRQGCCCCLNSLKTKQQTPAAINSGRQEQGVK